MDKVGWLRFCFKVLHPDITDLMQIMFVIPAQTAVVERGSSMHKIIKNRPKKRVRIMTLDPLLRVQMLCSMKKLDVDAAAQKSVVFEGEVGVGGATGDAELLDDI